MLPDIIFSFCSYNFPIRYYQALTSLHSTDSNSSEKLVIIFHLFQDLKCILLDPRRFLPDIFKLIHPCTSPENPYARIFSIKSACACISGIFATPAIPVHSFLSRSLPSPCIFFADQDTQALYHTSSASNRTALASSPSGKIRGATSSLHN